MALTEKALVQLACAGWRAAGVVLSGWRLRERTASSALPQGGHDTAALQHGKQR